MFYNAKLGTIKDPCMVNRASTKFQLLCCQLNSNFLLIGPCHSAASSAWQASASQFLSSKIFHRSLQEGQSHSRSDAHQNSVGEPDTTGAGLLKLVDQRSQQLQEYPCMLALDTLHHPIGNRFSLSCKVYAASFNSRLEPVLLVAQRLAAGGS